MDSLKVALCFSGQPRAWKIALKSIQEFISEFTFKPDIFMHVWNFNSTSNHVVGVSKGKIWEHTLIDKQELDHLAQCYNPTDILIEDRKKSQNIADRTLRRIVDNKKENVDVKYTPCYLAPQYYGIKKAAELKRNYELKHNFTYDLVIRMRYDTVFLENSAFLFNYELEKPKPSTVYSTHTFPQDEIPFMKVGDIFFYSDSHTYDIVAQYVDYLPYVFESTRKFLHGSEPHLLLSTYLQSMFLNICSLTINHKIARQEYYFDKLKEFNVKPYDCDIGKKDLNFI